MTLHGHVPPEPDLVQLLTPEGVRERFAGRRIEKRRRVDGDDDRWRYDLGVRVTVRGPRQQHVAHQRQRRGVAREPADRVEARRQRADAVARHRLVRGPDDPPGTRSGQRTLMGVP